MISVRFQGTPFNIMVIQVYASTINAEEAEIEQFYVDLQDLLEHPKNKQKNDVFFSLGTFCVSRNASIPSRLYNLLACYS